MYKITNFEDAGPVAPSRPLQLAQGPLNYVFEFPSVIHDHAKYLFEDFVASTSESTKQNHESIESLAVALLAHIAQEAKRSSAKPWINRDILSRLLGQVEKGLLRGDDIHTLAAKLFDQQRARSSFIHNYFEAVFALGLENRHHHSNLLQDAKDSNAKIFSIFGGQGMLDNYFEEFEYVHSTYHHFVHDFIVQMDEHLEKLSRLSEAKRLFPKGLKALTWLQNSEEKPDLSYLTTAPVSFPLIGLLQFTHYKVTCGLLGMNPQELCDSFKGLTGHSQGIITAVAIGQSDSWECFFERAKSALTLLFWIGVRSQQMFPQKVIEPSLSEKTFNEVMPTPMLSVKDLALDVLQVQIEKTNLYLDPAKFVQICLYNGPANLVVCGPPDSLRGLNSQLQKIKAAPDLDQARIPFRERKFNFVSRFLPVTAPFHSPYLTSACEVIMDDVRDLRFERQDLRTSVYSTEDGSDLRDCGEISLIAELVKMITIKPLHWKSATVFENATHVLDFGPGGAFGAGLLTQGLKDGQGVRIISATSFNSGGLRARVGGKEELLSLETERPVTYASNWLLEYGPSINQNSKGQLYLNTKFSKLLGLPPLMVAGMTPCTVHPDFVAATMSAGYHIELAGGGYFNPHDFSKAIRELSRNIAPGRGITINLIYINPAAIAWQIPMVQKLKAEGIAIDGLTIGAGVPSLEVATEYIKTIGLRHIAFKPGSVESIHKVIEIARENPDFPVILQWTGGRGGGHHSFEDFHQPIIQTYGKIRDCSNIILVGGSGFGGAEDTLPYLTGYWSYDFDLAPMPFDGILFGSRMMIAKEAHTSYHSKQLIVNAQGVEDSGWEATYKGSSGGVMTVLSEMREPIHMLATRGVKFWAEMDELVFKRNPSERVAILQRKRNEVIERLNSDFQKVWFGKTKHGKSVDLDEMTYSEVMDRMIELLYLNSQSRWIDNSYQILMASFVRRIEERFATDCTESLIMDSANITDPRALVLQTIKIYPTCAQQLVCAEDAKYFLALCQRRGQKPVPFVPALDENFEYWFKKDSLWQSENIDAVVDQDAERTCILQGPVAVKFSKVADEPIRNILDGIYNAHLQYFTEQTNTLTGKDLLRSRTRYLDTSARRRDESIHKAFEVHRISPLTHEALPPIKSWFELLGGGLSSWRNNFFNTETITQNSQIVENPLRRLFAPVWNIEVVVEFPNDPTKTKVRLRDIENGEPTEDNLHLTASTSGEIKLQILNSLNAYLEPVPLDIRFAYNPDIRYAPIQQIMDQHYERIKDFYWKIWFGNEERSLPCDLFGSEFDGGNFTITKGGVAEFVRAVTDLDDSSSVVPMDFAVKVAWKAIMKPLFLVKGNLLDLVHLYNGFRKIPNTEPLAFGDILRSTSRVQAIRKSGQGKTVEVVATISKDEAPILSINSYFHYRVRPEDDNETFEKRAEKSMLFQTKSEQDVKLLLSKSWLQISKRDIDLIDQTLLFRYRTEACQIDKFRSGMRRIQGKVSIRRSSPEEEYEIGEILFEDYFQTQIGRNPITSFLERHGSPVDEIQTFENAIQVNTGAADITFQVPGLPGTITHGMYLSSKVRYLIQSLATENDERRFHSFDCGFDDMVLPNERIQLQCFHIGMTCGRKILKIEASRVGGSKVLTARAEIEQPTSAYIFAGQGSQIKGMGMDLYAQNSTARKIWDRADIFLHEQYGFSILKIVRNNPKILKIHFGGSRGRLIRQNYMKMMVEKRGLDGNLISQKLFEDIDESTVSYTFSFPQGLLYSTEFAQPALTINAQAIFAIMGEKGIVQDDCIYAGHSLGEYAALSAFANVISLEKLVSLVFYRGLSMQLCVERDEQRRTQYSMCAFNPKKVAKGFDEAALRQVVQDVHNETGWLLEIVNFNIKNMQYVCAGDLRALDTLTSIIEHLSIHNLEPSVASTFVPLVRKYANVAQSKSQPLELMRTKSVVPLQGIDVPFHSTFLRPGISSFREAIKAAVKERDIHPRRLVHKYIPNLIGKPFEISKDYVEEVALLTGSPELRHLLQEWDT